MAKLIFHTIDLLLTIYCLATKLYTMSEVIIKYEQLMDILDKVFTKVELLHAPFRDFGTGVPMYRKEIHTLQAIGQHPKINITALAEHMGVTKGAVSQMVSKLVKKEMIRKIYAEDNKKEVILELTNLGRIGFHNHEKFHMDIFNIVREYYGEQLKTKLEIFKTVMSDLNAILEDYEKRRKTI